MEIESVPEFLILCRRVDPQTNKHINFPSRRKWSLTDWGQNVPNPKENVPNL